MSSKYRLDIEVNADGAKSAISSFKDGLLDAAKSSEMLNKAIDAAKGGFAAFGGSMGKVKQALGQMGSGASKASDEIDELHAVFKKLNLTVEGGRLKNAQGEFLKLGDGADDATDEVKQLTAELDKLGYELASGKIRKAKEDFVTLGAEIDKEAQKAQRAAEKNKKLADAFDKVKSAAQIGFAAITGTIGLSVHQANKLESAMAGVKKVIDFKSPDGLEKMRADLEKLSTQIPISTAELAQIAAAGGQLGVAEENLVSFTKVTADMATAFDMSAEAAGDSMAKLANIFGKPIDEMSQFGDMINTVSNNMPAKASEIVESLTRIGGSSKAFGLAEKQAVALSSAMISLGKAPEVASTAINSMITTLSTMDVADKDVKQTLQSMGIDAQKFGETIKKDGYAAIMQLLDGINKLPNDLKIGATTDLFGKNFGDDIVQLAGAPDVLEKINGLLAEQSNYIGSMEAEAKNVSDTSESKNKMFANALENASAAFGESFKPAVEAARDAMLPLLEGFTAFAKENPTVVAAIATFGAVLTGVVVAIGAVAAVLPTLTAGFTLIGAAVGVISAPIVGIVAGIAAAVAIGAVLYKNWDTLKTKAAEVWESVKQAVSNAVDSIKSFFAGGFSNIWNGIAEATSAAWAWVKSIVQSAWDSLTFDGDLLASVWESVKNGVATAWQTIKQAVIDKFNEIKQAFNEWLGGQSQPVQEMVTNILSIFEFLADGIGAIFGGLVSVGGATWEGIKGAASGAAEFIGKAWSKATETAGNAWEGVKSGAKTAFDGVQSLASGAADKLGSAWEKAKDGAVKAFGDVKQAVSSKLDEARAAAQSKMNEIKAFIEASGIGEFVGRAFRAATQVIQTAINAWKPIITGGIAAIKAILNAQLSAFAVVFNAAFNAIKTVVQTAFGVIKGVVTGDLAAVKAAISSGLSALAGIASSALSQMLGVFKTAGSQLRTIGGEIIQGLINGIKAKMGEAVAALRETASGMISAAKSVLRINSPSKVMHQIGEWVSQGLAGGIDADAQLAIDAAKNSAQKVVEATASTVGKTAKAVQQEQKKAAKERQKQAQKEQKAAVKQLEDYKKARIDAENALKRSIFIAQQQAIGNPYAELTADIKFGKFGNEDTTQLQALTEQNAALQTQAKLDGELADLQAKIAEAQLNEAEFLQWRYENTQDFLGISQAAFEAYKNGVLAAQDSLRIVSTEKQLRDKILALDEEIILAGKNELEVLQWQLANAKQYAGVSDEIKQSYYERVKALKQENELIKSQQAFERAKAVAANPADKYAGRRFDLQAQGYDESAIDGIIRNERNTDAIGAYQAMRDKDAQSAIDADPFAKLKQQHEERLAIIKGAHDAEMLQDDEFKAQMIEAEAQYQRAKTDLALSKSEEMFGSLASATKAAFGEQSGAYRAMFALEKAMAIGRSIMAIQTAIAQASASGPFPANLGAIATVASQTASIISNIKAVAMPVGQAHDGIMSVPKSGTWNLEKGERVLPKHTAKALDKRLDGMESGNNIAITINIDNSGNSQTSTQNANAMSKQMADGVEAAVLKVLRRESMQGGILNR